MAAYVSSKWALEGAMESLAGSVAPFGVRVAIIEPGTILTPIFGKGDLGPPSAYQTASDVLLRVIMHDLQRGSDPSVVADCVANAISTPTPSLRYLTGQGAERNIRVRFSMTDQQYVDLNRMSADEQVATLLDGES
jgi:NAD(P)-dependent dehydrogenase (short-subunit alcohol dehydrogenase family)